MGLKTDIQDRIEIVLARCQDTMGCLVQAGQDDIAVDYQTEVLDRLESVALELDTFSDPTPEVQPVHAPDEIQGKKRIRFKKKPGIRGKKYMCCAKPKRSRDRRGNAIWVTSCTWRAGTKHGNKPVMLGTVKSMTRPPRMLYATRKGGISTKKGPGTKKVRWC